MVQFHPGAQISMKWAFVKPKNMNKNIVEKFCVNVNDGLEIWGRGGQEMNFGFRVEKISGGFIEIWPEENADIKVGDAVHKNFDCKLNKKLGLLSQENYQRRVPASLEFDAEEGKSVILRINGAEARGEIAQKAQKKATDPETIKAQLAKLGGTVFTAIDVKINIKGELNIPLKDLNAVRREAVKELEKNIIGSFKRQKKQDLFVFSAVKSVKADDNAAGRKGALRQIAVQSDDLAVLDGLAAKNISRIYTALKTDVKKFHDNNIEVFQVLPRILRAGERLEIFSGYDGFLVPALGYLRLLPPQAKKTGDYQLNIFNSFSAEQLERMGFGGFTVSCESTSDEINGLKAGKMAKEAIVYGYLPLMTAEHCVLFGSAFCRKKNCGITDDKKITFPVFVDCANCRMQILNSRPLYFTDIGKLEVDSIRLIHTIETSGDFLKKVDNYLSGEFGLVENTTTGHFNRGVE